MTIKITNCTIINSGTGVHLEGDNVDVEIKGIRTINNKKDIYANVGKRSTVIIEDLSSDGCKTESITIKEYNHTIEELKEFVSSKENYFSSEEIKEINQKLDELKEVKNEPAKVKKIINEIYGVGKDISSKLLFEYIKIKTGWFSE
ncbi:hypothetical protein [Rossellomorea aquimaris]|uniref:hypothetical protein n=1 Tax=Rossellomorea aquimaris TaxID=189382 RepID=UPI0011E9779A|nr:hypothetical protein [Rossellomorea aquimaris]TYS87507.1 hypothetical protein FZC88_16055 [Rossellomorea aquimaris]